MRAAEAFLALAVCVASRAALGAIDKTGIGSAEAGKLCGLSGALKATARRALEEAAALRGKVAAAAQAMEAAEEALSEAGLKADTKGSALLDDMLRVTLDNGTKTGRTALIAQLALHAQETAADLARRATNTAGKIDQWVNTAFSIISKRGSNGRVCINDAGGDGKVTSGNTLMSSNGNALETPNATTASTKPIPAACRTAWPDAASDWKQIEQKLQTGTSDVFKDITIGTPTNTGLDNMCILTTKPDTSHPGTYRQAEVAGIWTTQANVADNLVLEYTAKEEMSALKALAAQMASSPGEQAAAVTWSKACTWKEHNLCTAEGKQQAMESIERTVATLAAEKRRVATRTKRSTPEASAQATAGTEEKEETDAKSTSDPQEATSEGGAQVTTSTAGHRAEHTGRAQTHLHAWLGAAALAWAAEN
ncbi:hypothetical protein ERJ75_001689800 [Trypanosoma vivax]|nr:hypothetical protein ERJ75_001689800 [Trypanosoma vivax]